MIRTWWREFRLYPWLPHCFFVLAFVCGVLGARYLMWMSVVGMLACIAEREWRKPPPR